MKVEVTRTHTTTEVVEVELPYYFAINCDGDGYDSTVYGRIEEKRTLLIHLNRNYGRADVSAEVEVIHSGVPQHTSYMQPEHKSTREEYLKARAQAIELLNDAA